MKIAVDVMGTDYGPKELVLGAVNAVKEYGCETVLVGDEKIIRELLVKYGADKNPKITIHHASEVIAMDEHPAIAVKSKKDASIVVAAGLLRNNECDALVSSGSTGAAGGNKGITFIVSQQSCRNYDRSVLFGLNRNCRMLVHRNYLAGMMNSNLRIFIRTVFYQQLTDYFFIANQNSFAAILFNSVDCA